MNLNNLLSRLDQHDIRSLDKQFAKFLVDLEPSNTAIEVAGFLVSYELGRGNVCLNLAAGDSVITVNEGLELKLQLNHSQLVYVIDQPINSKPLNQCPLVLRGDSVYLQRYFHYETSLTKGIHSRLQTMPWSMKDNKALLQSLFEISIEDKQEVNWQAVAACIAAQNKFSVISGGPGTGKTTTVIRLLALIIHQYQSYFQRNPIIKLAAPTGKAAMRLTQSITNAKAELNVDDIIKNNIPQNAETLHRLLQRDRQGGFKFNHHNRLHLDVLIVDEASMVDLPLLAKLIQAMPHHGQIILLGDKDQLASVEAGSVLADICDNEQEHGYSLDVIEALTQMVPADYEPFIEAQGASIRNHICHLKKSYRFDENSGIGHLAKAANQGCYSEWQKAEKHGYKDIDVHSLNDESYVTFTKAACNEFIALIKQVNSDGMDDKSTLALHRQYGAYQILCALKKGPLGVAGINEAIEEGLRQAGLLKDESQWYNGRPIIVLENDYNLNLYNGDVGILLPYKNQQGEVALKATFIGVDQNVRWIQPSRLPKHDTVYAMTVHKSQGSEFDHCALVLPNYSVPVLTKELIYTGITRAKNKLTILADGRVLKSSLKKKVKRASGLGDLLWKGDAVDTVKSQQLNQEPITSVSSDTEKFKNKKSSNKSDDAPQFDLF
ncbi:MAG: exodeoxyribonuclease V alpha subunit [Crocinitomicaceae bacterium]|jgi:exodeoxyribonuclease V alpha subunit